MINLLRGDFYKLKKCKAFYSTIIIVIVFILFTYGVYELSDKMMQQQEGTEAVQSVWEDVNLVEVTQRVFNICSTLSTVIFVAIFYYVDYEGGAMKNIVGKGYDRWKIFLSKYLATNGAMLIMQVIMVFATWLCMVIFAGPDRIASADYSNLIVYTSLQLLLGVSLTTIVIAINQFCRNLGAGITIGVSILLFSDAVAAGVDLLLKYLKFNVKFSDYWVYSLISNCPIADIGSNWVIRIVLSSLVSIAIALAVGTIHFQKTDIK